MPTVTARQPLGQRRPVRRRLLLRQASGENQAQIIGRQSDSPVSRSSTSRHRRSTQHAVVARQEQRGAIVAAGEDEERLAERRDRFEAHRRRRGQPGEQRAAHLLATPARPDRRISAVTVWRPAHGRVACTNASSAVGIGDAGTGRATRARAPHTPTGRRHQRRARPRADHCWRPFASLIFFSIGGAIDVVAVARQRALPGADRFAGPCRAAASTSPK